MRFCGFLARRDADCTLPGGAALPTSRKSKQVRSGLSQMVTCLGITKLKHFSSLSSTAGGELGCPDSIDTRIGIRRYAPKVTNFATQIFNEARY